MVNEEKNVPNSNFKETETNDSNITAKEMKKVEEQPITRYSSLLINDNSEGRTLKVIIDKLLIPHLKQCEEMGVRSFQFPTKLEEGVWISTPDGQKTYDFYDYQNKLIARALREL